MPQVLNCASLKNGKMASLNAEVKSTKANLVTLQEVHFREKGKIKLDKQLNFFRLLELKKEREKVVALP